MASFDVLFFFELHAAAEGVNVIGGIDLVPDRLKSLLATHQDTLARVVEFASDRKSPEAKAARLNHITACRSLYAELHQGTHACRIRPRPKTVVAADTEGGLHWRMGLRREVGAEQWSLN